MNLRIATAILIFLSLYLHTSARNDLKKKLARAHKLEESFKKKKHFHKVPVKKPIDENVSEKLRRSENEISDNKTEGVLEQTISQETIRKNQIEIVNSAELKSQIEDPLVAGARNNDNSKNKQYVIIKKKDSLNGPSKQIKEVIFIKGIQDIGQLLADNNLDAAEKQTSEKEHDHSIRFEIPVESKKNVIKFRKKLGTKTLHQESKESSHKESMERKQLKEKQVSEEEIERKQVVTNKNKRINKKSKHSNMKIDENSKSNKNKKYTLLKVKDVSSLRKQEVDKHNSESLEKSIATKKNIINETNISSLRKEIENGEEVEDDVPKLTRKIEHYIVTNNKNPSVRKQFKEEFIEEDINRYDNSKESIEIKEHIYARDSSSAEPESIEKYIHIENIYPSLERHFDEELVTENLGRKYGVHIYLGDELEKDRTKDYIIVKNKNSLARKQLNESNEIIDNSIKRKSEKIC